MLGTGDATIRNCRIGKTPETASWGVRTDSTVTGLSLEHNHVEAGGVGYSLGAGGDYNILKAFRNNTAASGVTTKIAGTEIVTEYTQLGTDGIARRHCIAARASSPPSTGAWVAGETIRNQEGDTAGSGFVGDICTASGTPGTWKTFGAISS